ncbi:DUF31 family putative serine protease [Mycoplasma seminis]|uniref:DUF31 domain-containing protein n=1 Tax=Mycoplasma seminis TaxID=512749 RepID=A0ABY9H9B4_9MOLU|nr:hypothetical protein [Mycoplasma seminis]WLP85177.1 hypothetical protein Q8852_02530 [Mycoplasma seminis]
MLRNNKDYINSIFNRTFTLISDYDDGSNTAGTIWLFDYHKISEGNFKLFFVTNYHVAIELYSDKDLEEYKQPNRTKQITNIRLGSKLQWDDTASKKYAYKRLSKDNWPRSFYLAHNFMDQETSQHYSRRYYTDFAVIEYDFNYNEFLKANSNSESKDSYQLAIKIKNAIDELDKSKTKFVGNKNYLMSNGQYPYAALDYGSVKMFEFNTLGLDKNNQPLLPDSEEKINEVSNGSSPKFV